MDQRTSSLLFSSGSLSILGQLSGEPASSQDLREKGPFWKAVAISEDRRAKFQVVSGKSNANAHFQKAKN